MKLHFEPDLDYQLQAVEAVCDLFCGQEICRTEFTVTRDAADPQLHAGFSQSNIAFRVFKLVSSNIYAWEPTDDAHVLFRDSVFANDVAKTNVAGMLNQNGFKSVRSL